MDGSGINEYVARQFDQSISWDDVKMANEFHKAANNTKGIMTKEDARLACKLGVSALARGSALKLRMKLPIFFDGGIREATRYFDCIALGANVFHRKTSSIWFGIAGTLI
ncbi:hypothetical protein PVAND_012439 [Polypedilum vanderplanki]|uniref:FMN-dependent dehydrogenase domain-containing protein n=1 Tax=Polypedilum vanderplanki TaxID=319348 RepID=A0A9J6CMH8_POLVA|nr:hypothetical protein PVAND_012439 [Polypedilum vanderplanki]